MILFLKKGSEPVALISAWFSFTTVELWNLAKIKQLTRNKLLDNYINYATDIIQKSVIAVNQIFVEKLKEQNAFTPEKQKEAFELAKKKILSMLNEDAKKILAAIYGDLNTFLDSQIEATVNNLKNQSIEKEE